MAAFTTPNRPTAAPDIGVNPIPRDHVCPESDLLRQQLFQQEKNIDSYAEQTEQFYRTANSEVLALRDQLAASQDQLRDAEAELSRMREEHRMSMTFQSKLQYAETQLVDANGEIDRLKVQINEEVSHNNYLRGQLQQQVEKANIAAEELERMAEDRTLTHLSAQLADAEREIIRLRNMITQYQFEMDRLRADAEEDAQGVHNLREALEEAHAIRQELEERAATAERRVEELMEAAQQRDAEEDHYHHPHPVPQQNGHTNAHTNGHRPSLRPEYPTEDPHDVQPIMQASPPRSEGDYAFFGMQVAEGAQLSKPYSDRASRAALRVLSVNGPCGNAGMQPADLVVSIGGHPVTTLEEFNEVVGSVRPHADVKVVFERDGTLLATDVLTEATHTAPGAVRNVSLDPHGPDVGLPVQPPPRPPVQREHDQTPDRRTTPNRRPPPGHHHHHHQHHQHQHRPHQHHHHQHQHAQHNQQQRPQWQDR